MEAVLNGSVRNTKAVGRRNSMTNIVVDRLDSISLREAASDVGLAISEDDSSDQVATSLQSYYRKKQAEDKTPLYECSVEDGGCGASTPVETGACPFCGFDPDAVGTVETFDHSDADTEVVAQATKSAEALLADLEAIPEGTEFTTGSYPEPVSVREVPEKKRRGRPPGKGKMKGQTIDTPGKEDVPGEMPIPGSTGSIELYDDTIAASQIQTAYNLDEQLTLFENAQKDTFKFWWLAALALKEIFDKRLWLLRVGADKKPKYTTPQQFIAAEIKQTPGYVFDRVDAASKFTQAEADKFGLSRCIQLSKAPEEYQSELKKRLHNGDIKNVAELAVEVVKANKEKGTVKSKTSKTGTKAIGAGRPKEFVKVAIANSLGKSTIPMCSGEHSMKIEEMPPAVVKWFEKTLPHAQHESLDGEIVETFGLLVKNGSLSLVIHRNRPGVAVEEEEDAEVGE